MWITVVYVDLKAENLEVGTLGSYINHVDMLGNSVEVKNWTGCSQFMEAVTGGFSHLQGSESLLKDTVGKGYGDSRLGRGILNYIGEISKHTLWHVRRK
jgi:hypothetical protein